MASTPTQVFDFSAVINLALNDLLPNMIAIGRNLTLTFAAILLAIVGIRMMIERNNSDQILFGEALKVFLLLGLALGILENYTFLRDLLVESVDYIIHQLGAGENIIDTLTKHFYDAPLATLDALDANRNTSPTHQDSVGLWDMLGVMWDRAVVEIGNMVSHVFLALIGGVFLAMSLMAGVYVLVYIAMATVLLGVVLVAGPICIPFLLVPKLDKIMWSWLDGVLYALVLKLVIAICVLLAGKMFPAAIPAVVQVDDMGAISVDYVALASVGGMIFLTLALVRSAFQVAGIIAGTRLAINPKMSIRG